MHLRITTALAALSLFAVTATAHAQDPEAGDTGQWQQPNNGGQNNGGWGQQNGNNGQPPQGNGGWNIVERNPDKPVYSANDLIRKQKLIADMQEYVLEMGVNPAIIALASKTSPVAGQDNPDGVLFLTRQQITAYEIENVPSAFADGQPIEQLAIPGVFPKASQQIVLEPLPQQQTIVLGNLNEAVSQGFVKNLFHVLEGEPADVLAYVDANYAELTNYYGKLLTKAELADVRRDYLKTWPYRRYTIDDNSMKASCDDRDNTCDVTGELDYELGLSSRGATVKGRSSFHFVILSPGQDARVMVDEGKTIN